MKRIDELNQKLFVLKCSVATNQQSIADFEEMIRINWGHITKMREQITRICREIEGIGNDC